MGAEEVGWEVGEVLGVAEERGEAMAGEGAETHSWQAAAAESLTAPAHISRAVARADLLGLGSILACDGGEMYQFSSGVHNSRGGRTPTCKTSTQGVLGLAQPEQYVPQTSS